MACRFCSSVRDEVALMTLEEMRDTAKWLLDIKKTWNDRPTVLLIKFINPPIAAFKDPEIKNLYLEIFDRSSNVSSKSIFDRIEEIYLRYTPDRSPSPPPARVHTPSDLK